MLELEARFGDVAYSRVHAIGTLRRERRTWGVALVGDVAWVDGEELPVDIVPFVGGRQGAPWLRYGELRGPTRALGGLDVAFPFVLDGHIRLRVRTGAAALDPGALVDARWTYGGELGAIWTTAVGPISAGAAIGRDGRWRAQLGIGPEW
jgi:hypothetical protein